MDPWDAALQAVDRAIKAEASYKRATPETREAQRLIVAKARKDVLLTVEKWRISTKN